MDRERYRFPWRKAAWVLAALLGAVVSGMMGYYSLVVTDGSRSVLDAFLHSSLTLAGLGTPQPENGAGKVFVALFALFGSIFFVAVLGVFIDDLVRQRLGGLRTPGGLGKGGECACLHE